MSVRFLRGAPTPSGTTWGITSTPRSLLGGGQTPSRGRISPRERRGSPTGWRCGSSCRWSTIVAAVDADRCAGAPEAAVARPGSSLVRDERTPSCPWQERASDVAAALEVDPRVGLSSIEAASRLLRSGPNRLDAPDVIPRWRRLVAQFADPLVYLLLGAAAISFVAWLVEDPSEVPFDVVVIVIIVVLNGVLGYVQESRAEEAVAALQRMTAATANVVRDGGAVRIPAADVVPGDILVIAEGDAVAADARLVETASLTVAEAALTGESETVLKAVEPISGRVPIGDRTNMVLSGTSVTRGRGRAVVTATGMGTEIGVVARLLAATRQEPTPLQREVDRIGRMLGVAVIVIALIVVTAIVLTSDLDNAADLVDVVLVGVSLAVAAVPEGLPAVMSVVLALGVQRMAARRAIVKRLSSVETLGSASVVCSDKTGTLTRNEMTIQKVVTASAEVDVTGSGYDATGELEIGGRRLEDPIVIDEVESVLLAGSLVNDASLRRENGAWVIEGDPTDAAFLVAEAKCVGLGERRRARYVRVGEVPFTSERKLMSTFETDLDREGRVTLVTKGAPDVLLTRCTHERVAGEVRPLTDVRRRAVLEAVDRLGDQALRTLGVASRALNDEEPITQDETAERDLTYLGMTGIIDPARPEARAAIALAVTAGIRTLMITGDHPRTAARIAADLGIPGVDRPVLTGSVIAELDDDALAGRGSAGIGVRPGRAGTQAPHRRRPAGQWGDRCDDGRRRE